MEMILCPISAIHTTEYLQFNLHHKTERTHHWTVHSTKHDVVLGSIKWFGAWRQYAFFPKPETTFNIDCLRDIAAFIDREMAFRKVRLEKRKIEVD